MTCLLALLQKSAAHRAGCSLSNDVRALATACPKGACGKGALCAHHKAQLSSR